MAQTSRIKAPIYIMYSVWAVRAAFIPPGDVVSAAPLTPKILCSGRFSTAKGENVEKLCTKKFCRKAKKRLTEGKSMRYTIKSQACPLCPHCTGTHHRGARPTSRTPHPGGKTLGGTYYEENFPAQEAPAQAGPRLSDPYEHQEWPQGHQCPPCQGPQEPDCLMADCRRRGRSAPAAASPDNQKCARKGR